MRALRGLLRRVLRPAHYDFPIGADGIVTSSDGRVLMAIDGVSDHAISGWAIDMEDPARRLQIHVTSHGCVIGRAFTCIERPDVAAAQASGSCPGFWLKLRADPAEIATASLRVVYSKPGYDDLPHLPGAERDDRTHLIVDLATPERVCGWVVDTVSPETPISLDILADGEMVASGLANMPRPDVVEAGFDNAYCGFSINLDGALLDAGDAVVVRRSDTRTAITTIALTSAASRPATLRRIAGSFDGLYGNLAFGWAWDQDDPDRLVEVEFLVDGAVVGVGCPTFKRPDVREAGFGGDLHGWRVRLAFEPKPGAITEVHARIKRTGEPLANSPQQARTPRFTRWLTRSTRVTPKARERLIRRSDARLGDRLLSIVMPVYDTPEDWLVEAIDSVRNQWCSRWELIIVDDGSSAEHMRGLLDRFALDSRIRVLRLPENCGIAAATNRGLAVARGDYVTCLDHDDALEPDAVATILDAAATGADLIYSDEIVTDETIASPLQLAARPAFSYDYYLSHPYFVHLVVVKREIVRLVGGMDESMAASADVDFVLRVLEESSTVAHVAVALYRWRTHPRSAGHANQAVVMASTQAAIERSLDRLRIPAQVSPGLGFNQYRIDFPPDPGRVLVIIPTKNRRDLVETCVESIFATTSAKDVSVVIIDHESEDAATLDYLARLRGRASILRYEGAFNFARMNNLAFAEYARDCRFVLLLNNDIEAIETGWLDRMRSLAARLDVGAVGATLLYPDDTIQHSGVIVGYNGTADHGHRFEAYRDHAGAHTTGHLCALTSTRECSAVTAAAMMMRADVFEMVGGLDEDLKVAFNDTDLCLRIGRRGLKILNDAHTVLYHHESATRFKTDDLKHPEDTVLFKARWRAFVERGDPFYSPALALTGGVTFESVDDRRGEYHIRLRPCLPPQVSAHQRFMADPAQVA